MAPAPNKLEDFWTHVDVRGEDECWEWTGARSPRGYGKWKVDGKHWRAHRLAFRCWNGLDPAELVVRHRCDNPPGKYPMTV